MARFRATSIGYYGDVIHDPETDHHVEFDAPDDFQASWVERVDAGAKTGEPETVEEVVDGDPIVVITEDVAAEADDEVETL